MSRKNDIENLIATQFKQPLVIDTPKSVKLENQIKEEDVNKRDIEETSKPKTQKETLKQNNRKDEINKVRKKTYIKNVYFPEGFYEKLVEIQYQNYKRSVNNLIIEAVSDLFKKYGK